MTASRSTTATTTRPGTAIGSLQHRSADTGSVLLSSQELEWGSPGRCPLCGFLTEHFWFDVVKAVARDDQHESLVFVVDEMEGSQGELLVSRCMSGACDGLALWLRSLDPQSGRQKTRLVYPQSGVRIPPDDGLEREEVNLYQEASDIAGRSPRAACALLRVLLEMLLKRHLIAKDHLADFEQRVPLARLIEMAVKHLDLTHTLETGLEAIRERGNTAAHDPYGLANEARAEDLPWLFAAVDDLVDDLHVKPKKWGGIAETGEERR